MNADRVVGRAWAILKKDFTAISIGVVLSFIVAYILFGFGYYLMGYDPVVIMLASSFFIGSVYIASRSVVEEHDFILTSQILARFVLNFSLIILLLILTALLPYPLNSIGIIVVVAVCYMAVPILAEMGYRKGCERIRNMLTKTPATYIGVNLLFFFGALVVVSLAVNEAMALVMFIALSFLYLPLYSLTGYLLSHSALQKK